MGERIFLEDIVESDIAKLGWEERRRLKAEWPDPLSAPFFVLDHPILVSTLTTTALMVNTSGVNPMAERELGITPYLDFGYASYLAVKTAGLAFGRNKLEIKKENRIRNFIIDNKTTIGLTAAGLLTALTLEERPYLNYDIIINLAVTIPLTAISTEILLHGIETGKKIRNAARGIKTNLLEKILNFPFEHPAMVGLMSGAYLIFDRYNHFQEKINTPGIHVRNFGDTVLYYFSTSAAMAASAVTLGLTFTSGILHGTSLRTIKNGILKNYYTAAGTLTKRKKYYKIAAEYGEKLLEIRDSNESDIETLVSLGDLYYNVGEIAEGHKCYRKAVRRFEKKDDNTTHLEHLKKISKLNIISRLGDELIREDNTRTIFASLLNNNTKALERLKRLIEKNPEDYGMQYVYGRALEILGYEESGRLQKLEAGRKYLREKPEALDIEGSKRKVLLFKEGFLGGEIVAKIGERTALEEEVEETKDNRKIIEGYERKKIAKPIGILDLEGKFAYIIEEGEGETLKKRIENGKVKLEDFLETADFLGLLQARKDKSRLKPEKDYLKMLKERMIEYGEEEIFTEELVENLECVVEGFSKVKRTYRKDGQPANWMVLEDAEGIMELDNERSSLSPVTYDMASLLGYHRALDEEQRRQVREKHRKSFRKYEGNEVNEEEYEKAYQNSMIMLAIENVTRRFIQPQTKLDLLQNAEDSIENLRREYYGYKNEYEKLNETIKHLSQPLLIQGASLRKLTKINH